MKFNETDKPKQTSGGIRIGDNRAGRSVFRTVLERMASVFPKAADHEDAPLYYPVCANYAAMSTDQKRAYRVRETKRREAEAVKPNLLDCPSAKREAAAKAALQAEHAVRKARLDAGRLQEFRVADRDDGHAKPLGLNREHRP